MLPTPRSTLEPPFRKIFLLWATPLSEHEEWRLLCVVAPIFRLMKNTTFLEGEIF